MNVYLQASFGKKHFGFTYGKRVDLTLQDVLLGKLEGSPITVEPHFTDTHLIRTPGYYGQFRLSQKNLVHIFSLKLTA